jgi:hypothetical protein
MALPSFFAPSSSKKVGPSLLFTPWAGLFTPLAALFTRVIRTFW